MPNRPQDERDENRMEFLLTLRRRGISDHAVLRAMDEVPREQFVGPDFVNRAYADQALPIECGQTISQPYVVAYMTEQLALRAHPPSSFNFLDHVCASTAAGSALGCNAINSRYEPSGKLVSAISVA